MEGDGSGRAGGLADDLDMEQELEIAVLPAGGGVLEHLGEGGATVLRDAATDAEELAGGATEHTGDKDKALGRGAILLEIGDGPGAAGRWLTRGGSGPTSTRM